MRAYAAALMIVAVIVVVTVIGAFICFGDPRLGLAQAPFCPSPAVLRPVTSSPLLPLGG